MKENLRSLFGLGTLGAVTVASWQQELEWWLRMVAIVSGIVIAWLTFYLDRKRKHRKRE